MKPEVILPKRLIRTVGQTVVRYGLLKEGDRVAVGLSGGKDSLTLLHLLDRTRRVAPYTFELTAVTVGYGMGEDPSWLEAHCAAHAIPFRFFPTDIYETSEERIRPGSSFCSYFSRMRRGALYDACKELGCNKLALGHHLDDAAESFFMQLFYNGTMRSMPPRYHSEAHDLEVIRPMIKAREEQMRFAAKANGWQTVGDEACPAFAKEVKMPHAREETKALLAELSGRYDDLFGKLRSGFERLQADTFFDERYHGEI